MDALLRGAIKNNGTVEEHLAIIAYIKNYGFGHNNA